MVRKSLHPGGWRREQPAAEEIVDEVVEEVTVFNPEGALTDGDPFPETEPAVEEPAVEEPAVEEPAVDYNSMTVAMLRDLLNERGLPVSGVKAELVARLEEDDASLSEESETLDTSEEAPSVEAAPSEEEVSQYGGTEQNPEN